MRLIIKEKYVLLHIKKSNRSTYFSFVIYFIIRVNSNPEEKFSKFPRAVWMREGALLAYR